MFINEFKYNYKNFQTLLTQYTHGTIMHYYCVASTPSPLSFYGNVSNVRMTYWFRHENFFSFPSKKLWHLEFLPQYEKCHRKLWLLSVSVYICINIFIHLHHYVMFDIAKFDWLTAHTESFNHPNKGKLISQWFLEPSFKIVNCRRIQGNYRLSFNYLLIM